MLQSKIEGGKCAFVTNTDGVAMLNDVDSEMALILCLLRGIVFANKRGPPEGR